jgi:ankyrin repeat protein
MGATVRNDGERLAIEDAILAKKTDSLLECFLDDDNARMLVILRSDVSYDFPLKQGKFRLPKILRNESTPIMHAAFMGAVRCVHTLIDLSIHPDVTDRVGLTAAHFACAGGNFDICRELDNLGVDFALTSDGGSPAKFACEFGRDEQVFWLWTRGALLAKPKVGWTSKKGGDPDVICAAALNGHAKVVRILVESVGLKLNRKLSKSGESAVSCACRNGHDEILEVLFELGARVNETALPAAIRSGSFRCVEQLLARKVKVDSGLLEFATACGHADVLGLLLRVCTDYSTSCVIAWLDGFGDGLRVMKAAGATPTWTASVVDLLMEQPGKAAEFAGVVPLPETMVDEAEWDVAELQGVIARLLRDGTATSALLRTLLEGEWPRDCSPFATCSTMEFAKLVFPRDLSTIGMRAFEGCSALERVVIPPGVKTIGDHAFARCSGLTHVEIPSSVVTIGICAFSGCSGLTEVEIPAGVTKIEGWAFEKCSALARVRIPSSVKVIGGWAFDGCSNLTKLEIPSGFSRMGERVFACVKKIDHLTLVGSSLSPTLVASLRNCLTKTAKVYGACLTDRLFSGYAIEDPE